LAFTTKADTLYAIALEQPRKTIVIALPDGQQTYQVSDIVLLGSTDELHWSANDGKIRIDAPTAIKGEHAWVFRISRTAGKSAE